MSENPEHDQPMPLVSHLTELRTRLLRCVAVIFLIFAGLFSFAQQIYTLVSAPLREHLPANATMIATDVASPFLTPFKLTMIVSLFLAIPVILHQIWGFIAPGLYRPVTPPSASFPGPARERTPTPGTATPRSSWCLRSGSAGTSPPHRRR